MMLALRNGHSVVDSCSDFGKFSKTGFPASSLGKNLQVFYTQCLLLLVDCV